MSNGAISYDEFRLVVTPAVGNGKWTVRIDESPVKTQVGISQSLQPTLSRADLATLRSTTPWPNAQLLKSIGHSVWESVLQVVQVYFDASRQVSETAERGLRVVLVRNQADPGPGDGGALASLAELPFEAMLAPGAGHYVATNLKTPVSRSLQQRPDFAAARVDPPLRVLVVAAQPADKPPADVEQEAAAILAALAPQAGTVSIRLAPNGSYATFRSELQAFRPHVFHFIGHGAYAPIGDDATPMPHLCFTDRPVDADVLSAGLQNHDVRLVVLTACSTAAAAPGNGAPYAPGAMEGLAQTLVFGPSGVRAAVAMQFDFESTAAVTFSRVLYAHLLTCSLDEAVTHARVELTQQEGLGPGHRAWVCPVVYSRCVDHRVFDVASVAAVDSEAQRALDQSMQTVLQTLDQALKTAPQGFSVASFLQMPRDFDERRSQNLQQGLRLSIESARPGGTVRLRVLLRLASAGAVDLIDVKLGLPEGLTIKLPADDPGGGAVPAVSRVAGGYRLLFVQPLSNHSPGEHELGVVPIELDATVGPGVQALSLSEGWLSRAGQKVALASLSPVLLVER